MREHWCFCGACSRRTPQRVSVEYLFSDEHGKIGKYNIYSCDECMLVTKTEWTKLAWVVFDDYSIVKVFTKETDARAMCLSPYYHYQECELE